MSGILITFEGIEGCGKSTQTKKLFLTLSSRDYPVLETREPGGTLIGEKIREFLLSTDNSNIFRLTELFLYAADRTQHIKEVIKPALENNKIVLCDRFIDSTLAYQGYGRGIDFKIIAEINNISTLRIKPDLTFLLDLTVREGLARAEKRKKKDRIEKESLAFHEIIRKGYLKLAQKDPERIKIIPAQEDQNKIHARIKEYVGQLFSKRGW